MSPGFGPLPGEVGPVDDPLRVRLGTTVTGAIERNEQAFVVAKALGQVSRNSMHGCPHLGDIGFRCQLLLFLFLGVQTVKFHDFQCRPSNSMLWSADRQMLRFEVQTVKFDDLECRPSNSMNWSADRQIP